MLNNELRPGSQNCQNQTAEVIADCMGSVKELGLSGQTLLRLDSGNDAQENFTHFGQSYSLIKLKSHNPNHKRFERVKVAQHRRCAPALCEPTPSNVRAARGRACTCLETQLLPIDSNLLNLVMTICIYLAIWYQRAVSQ